MEKTIMDRVKSFEDACVVLGISPSAVIIQGDTPDEIAYRKLKIIAQALNEGWAPDWKNEDEWKYYPWFWMDQPGSGFSCCDYAYAFSHSYLGSRLCYKSRELAMYAGKQFESIYKDFLTL